MAAAEGGGREELQSFGVTAVDAEDLEQDVLARVSAG